MVRIEEKVILGQRVQTVACKCGKTRTFSGTAPPRWTCTECKAEYSKIRPRRRNR